VSSYYTRKNRVTWQAVAVVVFLAILFHLLFVGGIALLAWALLTAAGLSVSFWIVAGFTCLADLLVASVRAK